MSRFKFMYGHFSTHAAWSLGLRFDDECLGGYAALYGWPLRTWLIIASIGHQSWCIGIKKVARKAGAT